MSLLYDAGEQATGTASRHVLEDRVRYLELLNLLDRQGEHHVAFWDTAIEQG